MRLLLVFLVLFSSQALAGVTGGPVVDATGKAVTSTPLGAYQALDINVTQHQDFSGSGTIAVSGGAVTATTNGAGIVNFVVSGVWVATLTIEGSVNGSWAAINGDEDASDTFVPSITINGLLSVAAGGYSQVRLRASSYTSGTATINWEAGAGTSLVEIFNTNAASLKASVNLNDGSGNAIASGNSQLAVRETLTTGGIYGNIVVGTSAAVEVKVGASRLTNRRMVTLVPVTAEVYWGYDSSVTTASGSPVFVNQMMAYNIDAAGSIYVISTASGSSVRVTESP